MSRSRRAINRLAPVTGQTEARRRMPAMGAVPGLVMDDTVPSDLNVFGIVYSLAPVTYAIKGADQNMTTAVEDFLTLPANPTVNNLDVYDTTNDQFTPTIGGLYRIFCHIRWEIGAGGERRIRIYKNSATVIGQNRLAATVGEDTYDQFCEALIVLDDEATPTFQFAAYQDSGATLKVLGDGTPDQSWFCIQYLGRVTP